MRATAIVFLLVVGVTSGQAGVLQTYAFSQGGESTSGASGPTGPMSSDYPGGPSGKLYQFTPAPGSGVEQSLDFTSAATGPLTATSAVTASGIAGGGTYIGSSDAHAAYGKLGVDAYGTYDGLIDPSAKLGSESFATFTDSFTVRPATGLDGLFFPTFTVSGLFDASGRAAAEFELDYQVASGPALMVYRVMSNDSAPSLYYNGFVSSLPGLTVGPTSVSGTTDVSFGIPFAFNVPFDVTVALYASEIPSSTLGSGIPSQASVDFAHTATLTGITVLSGGQSVDFTIQSGSGTVYTAAGVGTADGTAAPEPASFGLIGAGLAILAGIGRRRLAGH